MTPANFPTGSTSRRVEPCGTDREHAAISRRTGRMQDAAIIFPRRSVTPVTAFAQWVCYLTIAG